MNISIIILSIVTLLLSIFTIWFNSSLNNPFSDYLQQKIKSIRIKERYVTERDILDNVDSLVMWHHTQNSDFKEQHWLIATAKSTDVLLVYNGIDGKLIKRVGNNNENNDTSAEIQQPLFKRPNGIVLFPKNNMIAVVERDSHRLQILSLPDFRVLFSGATDKLKRPYGITVIQGENMGEYDLFITDNYMDVKQYKEPIYDKEKKKYRTEVKIVPPSNELDSRIKHFSVSVPPSSDSVDTLSNVNVKFQKSFGMTQGDGILHKVETIVADHYYQRLLVADEDENQKNVKVFSFNGEFTGQVIGSGLFEYEPEGIAIYSCDNDTAGYLIMTDQHKKHNRFHVFDRETFQYKGTFAGHTTLNTDGVTLTQRSFPGFDAGAFFAVHADGSVGAFSWTDIAQQLKLRDDCIDKTPLPNISKLK